MPGAALELMAFKSIHVLNDVAKGTDENGKIKLRATHYACVLVYGRAPVWGVWTVNWRFVMFCGSRQQIADQYPNKAWTVTMASWLLSDAESDYKDIGKRVRALEDKYGGRIERDAPGELYHNVPKRPKDKEDPPAKALPDGPQVHSDQAASGVGTSRR